MSYITLSPNWCPLCKKENESQNHLFIQCTYAQNFWITILNIFECHLTFPREVKDFLDMALTYHPFKNAKALLWENLIMAFFWNRWKKRNKRIFVEKTQTYTKLFDNVVYQAISWCKLRWIYRSSWFRSNLFLILLPFYLSSTWDSFLFASY